MAKTILTVFSETRCIHDIHITPSVSIIGVVKVWGTAEKRVWRTRSWSWTYKTSQIKTLQHENHDICVIHEYFTPHFSCSFSTLYAVIQFNSAKFSYYLAKWCSVKVNIWFSLVNSVIYRTFQEFPKLTKILKCCTSLTS